MEHSHYSNFDVMAGKQYWDEHTRQIIERRLEPPQYQTLTKSEIVTLFYLCSTLVGDTREPIIHYMVSHFDNKLISNIGEAQRKKGLPKQSDLIRIGLKALNKHSMLTHGKFFDQLTGQDRSSLIQNLIDQNPKLDENGIRISAKDFLSTVATEAVSAYYSHPSVWSEIGYAGPAYPRGYVRTERGLTDPWEAKRNNA